MYLTDKKNGVPRNASDHDELEVLLESFSKQVEEIVNEAENTQVRLPVHLTSVFRSPVYPESRGGSISWTGVSSSFRARVVCRTLTVNAPDMTRFSSQSWRSRVFPIDLHAGRSLSELSDSVAARAHAG